MPVTHRQTSRPKRRSTATRPAHYGRARLVSVLAVAAMAGSAAVLLAFPAWAGPITNPGAAPFVKLGIYQGVLTVAPGAAGTNVLEIGNAGRDIASDALSPKGIYFRPSSLNDTNGTLFYRDASGKGSVDLQAGKLCLNNAGLQDCRSVWPGGGVGSDPYWNLAGNILSTVPANSTGMRIGTFAAPLAASSDRGLAVYESSGTQPAVRFTGGTVYLGYDNAGTWTGGKGKIEGNLEIHHDQFFTNANAFGSFNPVIRPWTKGNDGLDSFLDADTFDGTVNFSPWATNGNLFILTMQEGLGNGSTAQYEHICLSITNADGICTSGTNRGGICSTSAQCPGGSCQILCDVAQEICPADPVGKHCSTNTGVSCTTAADCPLGQFGEFCIRGRLGFTLKPASGTIDAACKTQCTFPGQYAKCSGVVSEVFAQACSTVGSLVSNTEGKFVSNPNFPISGCTPNPGFPENCACDCYFTQDKPYMREVAVCEGGSRVGQTCTGPGQCGGTGQCVGGTNAGNPCTNHGQCPGSGTNHYCNNICGGSPTGGQLCTEESFFTNI